MDGNALLCISSGISGADPPSELPVDCSGKMLATEQSALLARPRQRDNQILAHRSMAIALFFGLVASAALLLSREWRPVEEVTILEQPQNDALLKERIKNLTAALENANKTIQNLKSKLLKCKNVGSGQSSDSDKSESDDGGKGASLDGDQERYQQYLLDFKINDDAQRKSWPWLDNTLFYKLGGANRIQYSDADAAIDAGQAERYGRDRAFSMDNLDDSFNDGQYYGST